ncbi:hypothetical protein [Candidatus Sulfurimonas baltica]|uniref:Uncharacterized protein n=1 Tax=Candidatus Sulfurimonas baltica TaxID=2740404 RepID=A0A7S7LTG8_9BACT|nr:hypothetical protein [Candidatus Sulfurimonas baltica]QOY51196.1 hypothetical protein HUE88_08635 [Candidatus Sulfurimonas baltica]
MSTKKEYREIINLEPIVLYKKDLLELENIIVQDKEADKLTIDIKHDNTTYSANTIDELFLEEDLPLTCNRFSLSMHKWADKNIISGVYISLNFNHADFQLNSSDSTWYYGKKHQIKDFFQKRKPWYSFLIRIYTWFGGFSMLFLFYAAYLFSEDKYISMILPILMFIILTIAFPLMQKQLIFPYIKINTYDKKKTTIGLNEVSLVIASIAGLLTIIQIASNIFK